MNEQQLYRRLVRRASHRSRSFAVVVALLVAALVIAYAGIESVLAAVGVAPLLLGPTDAIAAVEKPTSITIAVAAVALVLGVVLLISALSLGRRARHELPDSRMAVVIDDQVIAGAISTAIRIRAKVPTERVTTSVSRRRGRVRVTPTSGSPLDVAALTATAEGLVSTLDPKPPLRTAVTVAEQGVVGS